jgi:hypothetical protein
MPQYNYAEHFICSSMFENMEGTSYPCGESIANYSSARAVFRTMRNWVMQKLRLMQTMDAAEFTAMFAIQQTQMMKRMIEKEASAGNATVAKPPDKFKDPKTFRIIDEGMWTYFWLLKGTGPVPLKDVIWDLPIAEAATVYQTIEEQQVAITPLFGPDFDLDNARV